MIGGPHSPSINMDRPFTHCLQQPAAIPFLLPTLTSGLCLPPSVQIHCVAMSTCGNCDCADKSQCVKKGNSYGVEIIETEKSYRDNAVEVVAAAAALEGDCKCGPACMCVNCTCGN